MDVGLTDVKYSGIVFRKNLRQSRSDTGMILTGYIDQDKFELRFSMTKELFILF